MLDDAARAVCLVIVSAPEAWANFSDVIELCGEDAVKHAADVGAIVLWDRPDFPVLTLTPWGAECVGVEIDEVWRPGWEEREEWEPRRPAKQPTVHYDRTMIETPIWVREGLGSPSVRLPKHVRIGVTLVRPDLIEDEPTSPEYLTDDEGQPVTVFGQPVKIDRRIR